MVGGNRKHTYKNGPSTTTAPTLHLRLSEPVCHQMETSLSDLLPSDDSLKVPSLLFSHLLADMRRTPRHEVVTEAFKWMSSALCVSLCLLSVSVIYVSQTNKFPQSQAPCSAAEPVIWPNWGQINPGLMLRELLFVMILSCCRSCRM